jgi:G3E family GTPase
MIPLCLITGFLGAGKTTLLQYLAGRLNHRSCFFLVNEFSDRPIDSERLSPLAPRVATIPGGSIFCTCLVSEFIRHLTRIREAFPDMDSILVEASGIANPKVVDRLLRETGLAAHFRLQTVLTMVDPGTFAKLRETLPNITAQIEAADIVLINKTDLYSSAQVAQTEQMIQELNPDVPCLKTAFGKLDWDQLLVRVNPHLREGAYARCRDPLFFPYAFEVTGDVDWNAFQAGWRLVQSDFYRLKGYLHSEGEWWYVDYSGGELGRERSPVPRSGPGLAAIMRANASDTAGQFLQHLREGRFNGTMEPQPTK